LLRSRGAFRVTLCGNVFRLHWLRGFFVHRIALVVTLIALGDPWRRL
jgi:hypothetical protein